MAKMVLLTESTPSQSVFINPLAIMKIGPHISGGTQIMLQGAAPPHSILVVSNKLQDVANAVDTALANS